MVNITLRVLSKPDVEVLPLIFKVRIMYSLPIVLKKLIHHISAEV